MIQSTMGLIHHGPGIRCRFMAHDDFFEFIIENAGLLCIAWLTLVVRAFGVTVLKHATDLALDDWMQQVIQRAGVVQIGIFAITNGIVVAKIIRYFVRKRSLSNNE